MLFLPEFPLTATGKVQRFRLREHAIEVLAAQAPAARSRAGRAGLSRMLDGRLLVDAHVHVARLTDAVAGLAGLGAHVRRRHARSASCSTRPATPRPAAIDEHFAGQGADHVLLFTEYSPKATGIAADRGRAAGRGRPTRTGSGRWPTSTRTCTTRSAAELARQVGLGAVALKIHPVHGGFEASDRMLYPAYAWAEEHGLPVIVHCGTSTFAGSANAYADPVLLDPVFRDFPEPDRGARARRPGLVVRAGRVPGPDAAERCGWRCPGCRRSGCRTTTGRRCGGWPAR